MEVRNSPDILQDNIKFMLQGLDFILSYIDDLIFIMTS